MKDIDKYAYMSALRPLDPTQKVLLTFLLLITCLCSSSIVMFCFVIGLMGWITIYKGHIVMSLYLKLMTIPLTFLLLSILTLLFEFSSDASVYLVSLPIGNFYVGITSSSLQTVCILFFKVFASVSCLYFLCLSTPMTDILRVFEKVKCPTFLIEMMSLIYRFIFVLIDTAFTMHTAQASRLGYKSFRLGIKSLGMLLSTILIRTLKINNNLYTALECRGYAGSLKVLNEDAYKRINYFYFVILEAILLGLIALENFLLGR